MHHDMKAIITIYSLFITSFALAQTDQHEIDNQVWKPFAKAIMEQDVHTFVSLHSADLIRAELNEKNVLTLPEYKKRMEESWPRWKESMKKDKTTYTFELRFSERISNGNFAYETGYFKNEMLSATGDKQKSFGKFHVTLRREKGVWKIIVDSDSNEGGTITEEMFMAARPVGQ